MDNMLREVAPKRIILFVPGMPLTNIVTSIQPGGKPVTGAEVYEFVDQFVDNKNKVCPLSMLRNCTTG